jgi:hypothetical protein
MVLSSVSRSRSPSADRRLIGICSTLFACPDSAKREALETLFQGAEFGGQQPPPRTGVGHPEHRLEKQARRRLLDDVAARMLFPARPDPPPLVARWPLCGTPCRFSGQ